MAKKSIAWQTGTGNIILTYTGQGNGTIQVTSDPNPLGSARSQVISIQTTKGGIITKNVTVSQAACPFPVGDVRNYTYTGSYQEVELPAGQYKLQCWGAQGGSNAAASSYGITAQAGGKGGYSEGIITLSQTTIFRVYVGGQGSSSAGGFNGGGSTTGSSSYSTGTSGQAGYHFGTSRMGGGGGSTDIRLSDGALLSRMIVAGGGSGGAMCYKKETTTVTSWEEIGTLTLSSTTFAGYSVSLERRTFKPTDTFWTKTPIYNDMYNVNGLPFAEGDVLRWTVSYSGNIGNRRFSMWGMPNEVWILNQQSNLNSGTFTVPSGCLNGATFIKVRLQHEGNVTFTIKLEKQTTSSHTTTDSSYTYGYVGGGTTGGGYSSTYQGKQSSAGSGGSFGQGANQTATNYRYCSGAGGGGWYGGGGGQESDSSMTYCKYSGGGSGFVNTAASAGNRPSGYTGLQLDSGETKAGNTSFPSTSGGNETGHAGNGYARITRLS